MTVSAGVGNAHAMMGVRAEFRAGRLAPFFAVGAHVASYVAAAAGLRVYLTPIERWWGLFVSVHATAAKAIVNIYDPAFLGAVTFGVQWRFPATPASAMRVVVDLAVGPSMTVSRCNDPDSCSSPGAWRLRFGVIDLPLPDVTLAVGLEL